MPSSVHCTYRRWYIRSSRTRYPAYRQWTRFHQYATQSSSTEPRTPPRKQVTIASDDGRAEWKELSVPQKVARTAHQSFNLLTILTGMVMTGGVITLLYLEVFSSDSKTSHFNHAVDRIKKDPRCIELLGNSKKITAYGDGTSRRLAKSRQIASTLSTDKSGTEHLVMRFNVEGPENKGVVSLHMTKPQGQSKFEYRYLALDVKGHPRIYLENADAAQNTSSSKGSGVKMFGIRWS